MDEEFEVPPHIQELVATDNSRFEDWVRQVKDFRVRMRMRCSLKRELKGSVRSRDVYFR